MCICLVFLFFRYHWKHHSQMDVWDWCCLSPRLWQRGQQALYVHDVQTLYYTVYTLTQPLFKDICPIKRQITHIKDLNKYKSTNFKPLFTGFSLVQSEATREGCKNHHGQEEVRCLLAGAVCKERTWDAAYCCVRPGRIWPQQHSESIMMVCQKISFL